MHVVGDHYRSMTDGAVVVVLLLLLCVGEFDALARTKEPRDYILVLIVREFGRKL